ncbi:MAG: hypothetical protein JSS60_02775 [Verrucomicrobia bacterium]|nr:hypothetical protein [Verrucomicrobiota bacterium]
MRTIKKLILSFFFIVVLGQSVWAHTGPANFATATDTEHYRWTLNLIAGIHRYHFAELGEIAVYDLGLTPEERSSLNSLSFVQVYDVEQTNPDMFKKFTVNKQGKIARGWYSWKPVVIKQAMDLFADFIYLDSGISLTGPLDLWFDEVRERGYFFIDCGHTIGRMTPKPLIEKFHLDSPENKWILKSKGISSGIQGLSRMLYASYVMPCFVLSSNIANFQDDGSCPKGFGWARHDQTIFSIQARLNDFQVNEVIKGGKLIFNVNGRPKLFSLGDFIQITRGNFDLDKSKQYLKYK